MTTTDARMFDVTYLNDVCQKHTAFPSFADLLAAPNYRPSIDVREPWGKRLADAYDAFSTQKAHRYGEVDARTEAVAQAIATTPDLRIGYRNAVKAAEAALRAVDRLDKAKGREDVLRLADTLDANRWKSYNTQATAMLQVAIILREMAGE